MKQLQLNKRKGRHIKKEQNQRYNQADIGKERKNKEKETTEREREREKDPNRKFEWAFSGSRSTTAENVVSADEIVRQINWQSCRLQLKDLQL